GPPIWPGKGSKTLQNRDDDGVTKPRPCRIAAPTRNDPETKPRAEDGAADGEFAMNLIKELEQEQIAKLTAGKEIPDFAPGDTVIVNVKVVEGERTRVQAYEGVCIGRSGGGLHENFTVRKISYGEGVERVFPLFSPMIDSIKVLRRGKVRRAKLDVPPFSRIIDSIKVLRRGEVRTANFYNRLARHEWPAGGDESELHGRG